MSLFTEIRDAEIYFSNHESDLYFRLTEQTMEILNRYPLEKRNSRGFICDGQRWMDVPFAYDPYWEKRCPRKLSSLPT